MCFVIKYQGEYKYITLVKLLERCNVRLLRQLKTAHKDYFMLR